MGRVLGLQPLPTVAMPWKAVEEGRSVKAFADPPRPVEGRKLRSAAAPHYKGSIRVL